jgi:hypothetical protein
MADETTVGAGQDTNETATGAQQGVMGGDAGRQDRETQAPKPDADPVQARIRQERQDAEAVEKQRQDADRRGVLGGDDAAEGDKDKKKEGGEGGAPAIAYEDFTIPDNFVADPEMMGLVKEVSAGQKLTQEQAQGWVDAYFKVRKSENAKQAEALAENDADWARQIRGHPEFGGQKFKESSEKVGAAIRKYGSPLLTAQIRQMNIQNWPELYYFVARMADDAMADDKAPTGNAGGPGAASKSLDAMFPGIK